MDIKRETTSDRASVRALNVAAFQRPQEADLVDAIRETVKPLVSLVAHEQGETIGFAMFSAVTISGVQKQLAALGPVAVAPEKQGEGIGGALIRAGIEECKKLGFGAVFVLGHPTYYPRFGFVPAKDFGITCEFARDENSFMVLELQPNYLRGVSGKVEYAEALNGV